MLFDDTTEPTRTVLVDGEAVDDRNWPPARMVPDVPDERRAVCEPATRPLHPDVGPQSLAHRAAAES